MLHAGRASGDRWLAVLTKTNRVLSRREAGVRRRNAIPMIANVQILDFDGDGRNDVIACDAPPQGLLGRRNSEGECSANRSLQKTWRARVYAIVVDLDRDGDLDLVVSILGDNSAERWRGSAV